MNLGHSKLESAVQYLGLDALDISEQPEIRGRQSLTAND
jgi:hypothetical protein